jgi:hypothetical protein
MDHKGMAAQLTRNGKGVKKCCMSNALDRIDYDTLWNSNEDDGDVREVESTQCEDGDSDTDW